MTDTMQALYRYTAEGRFSSYLTGADYREVCRVLDKLEQTLRQLRRAGPPVPPGNRPPGATGPGAGGHVPGRLDRRPGGPVTRAPAPVPRLRRAAKRPRPSFVSRPAAAAALPPAMPLRGEPDRRHSQ